jgi:uncharacterized membrane protein
MLLSYLRKSTEDMALLDALLWFSIPGHIDVGFEKGWVRISTCSF